MEEIFGFQKLKISFSEILFQEKPSPRVIISIVLIAYREEVICKKRNVYCSELYKSQFTIPKLQYDEVINGVSNMKMSMQKKSMYDQ